MRTVALTAPRATLLLAGLGGALAVRVGLAGSEGAGSRPAGLAFAAALLLLIAASGWRPARPHASPVLIGLLGACVPVALPTWREWTGAAPALLVPAGSFLPWAIAVSAVAVAEEAFFRGALFDLVDRMGGAVVAVVVTAAAFALIHVPLYGWQALPLDVAVGLWLGGLRLVSGSVAAPAVAHILADLAAWWLL